MDRRSFLKTSALGGSAAAASFSASVVPFLALTRLCMGCSGPMSSVRYVVVSLCLCSSHSLWLKLVVVLRRFGCYSVGSLSNSSVSHNALSVCSCGAVQSFG